MHICNDPSGHAAVTIGRVTNVAPEAHAFTPLKRKRDSLATIRTGSSSCEFQTPERCPTRASSRAVSRCAAVANRPINWWALTCPS